MKEFEYKSIQGMEDLNIAEQLDSIEQVYANTQPLGAYLLFDFSMEPSKTSTSNNGLFFPDLPQFANIQNSYDYLKSSVSAPMDQAAVIVHNDINNEYVIQNNTIKDITDEYNVPFWDKNAVMYLGQGTNGALGNPSPANYLHTFRSGYVEFTIKTNNQNCVIASGNAQYSSIGNGLLGPDVFNVEASSLGDSGKIVHVDSDKAYLVDAGVNAIASQIIISNGKLGLIYENKYGNNKKKFVILGNTNIADDNWHHIVINFVKPGTPRTLSKKHSNKEIQFWVDGNLDIVNDEHVKSNQVIFPTFTWLFMNPQEIDKEISVNTEDLGVMGLAKAYWRANTNNNSGDAGFDALSKTNIKILDLFNYGPFNTEFNEFYNKDLSGGITSAFSGAMHTYIHGLNIPLSPAEIKERLRWWKNQYRSSEKAIEVSALLIEPTVATNSKKALKLFWNNLISSSKHGVELDKTYDVHTYSVTHKSSISSTELYNLDLKKTSTKNILENVRVVITDNIIEWGPGKVPLHNLGAFGFPSQFNPNSLADYDALSLNPQNDFSQSFDGLRFSITAIQNLYFSGVELKLNDRILLTNQFDQRYNGIYVFNGVNNPITRAKDADSPQKVNNAIVYVSDGYYANSYWFIENKINSLNENQFWSQLEDNVVDNFINFDFKYTSRWSKNNKEPRFIDVLNDIDLSKFDLITFMNYPETNFEIEENFIGYDSLEIQAKYNDFITSLKLACANGANLMVTSPRLAEDLGIVRHFTQIEQEIENGDGRSAVINPFQFDEPSERYFDTHRQNAYHVDTVVPGLTDKETWVMTEAINYIPKDEYDYEQWHLKYSYRQFGLQEGNEFLIPSLPLRQVATKDDLPGFRANARKANKLNVVAPRDVLAGTVVTSLANTHYHGAALTSNEFDDYATTIIVHNGQQLGGTPINGKIFVNCVEDAYTMSREEYNKATIQVVPNDDPFETNATKQWQYSTSRLNRLPRRINVKELTPYGQTTPTNGGGGPLVQAATNSSNGIIRSATDRGNKDYQSDLYPQETEEVYPIQEIPVLSMTWLGLQWLAG